MVLPFMYKSAESGSHPARYDMSNKRNVLISTCGFYTTEGNYDAVISMFNHLLGKDNYEKIFCSQGELFRVSELSNRTNEYLDYVKTAGREYISGKIKTNRILTFMWGILYVLTSIMTFFVMKTSFSAYLGIINNILPVFMGIFTAWFQKWYPAKVARR